jgi:4-diphosphocytidyl-2C-methyl-D-erythritol kinase
VPATIGTVVSKGLATLHELDTVYGTQDLYDMLEIIAVDAHNERVMRQAQGAK